MRPILFILLFGASFRAAAQEYSVERDTLGRFLLLQNGQKTAFDTSYVVQSLAAKVKEEAAIKTEVDLLERLILLRRQMAVVADERKTLEEIIKKARHAK